MHADPLDFIIHAGCIHLPPRDLMTWAKDDMPTSSGAYVLIADNTFNYPGGTSPVFYIGKADRLRRRLRQHKQGINRASGNRKHAVYLPPYEYGAKFGAQVAIVDSNKPRETEFQLLAYFAKTYLSLPVANNAVNRRSIRKLFAAPPIDG